MSGVRGSRASSVNAVPVTDPDFKYSESRNIYAKKLQAFAGKVYADHQTELHPGNWRSAFSSTKRDDLHLELGCNAGHVVTQWALRDPQCLFIGLDWKYKPIFRGAEKAKKLGLENLIFFRAHAERVGFMFAENELTRISIFFPDPWPKKKHFKNRWITTERLRDLYRVLSPGGILHIKTDHPGYFDWIQDAVSETRSLWETLSNTRDLHGTNPDATQLQIPDVTLFERLFIHDGLPIHELILKPVK